MKVNDSKKYSPEGESNTRSQDYNLPLQSRALANWAIRRFLENWKSESIIQTYWNIKALVITIKNIFFQPEYSKEKAESEYLFIKIVNKVKKKKLEWYSEVSSWSASASRNLITEIQFRTGHGVLGKYFRTGGIYVRDHNCECGQLETVEHVLKECPLHLAERDLLRKVSPELR